MKKSELRQFIKETLNEDLSQAEQNFLEKMLRVVILKSSSPKMAALSINAILENVFLSEKVQRKMDQGAFNKALRQALLSKSS